MKNQDTKPTTSEALRSASVRLAAALQVFQTGDSRRTKLRDRADEIERRIARIEVDGDVLDAATIRELAELRTQYRMIEDRLYRERADDSAFELREAYTDLRPAIQDFLRPAYLKLLRDAAAPVRWCFRTAEEAERAACSWPILEDAGRLLACSWVLASLDAIPALAKEQIEFCARLLNGENPFGELIPKPEVAAP